MATSLPEVADSIETFIRREFRISHESQRFMRDDHLFESGYVDSAGVVELIAFIESAFDLELADEHIFSEQFTTINGIAGIVMTCQKPNELRATVR